MRRAGPRISLVLCLWAGLLALGLALLGATAAFAQEAKTAPPEPATAATPVPSGLPDTPAGYLVDAAAALSAADQDSKIEDRKAELGKGDLLTASLEAEAVNVWEVSYYLNGTKQNLVIVDGTTGAVNDSFTGSAVTWPMARGKEGQFGHILNAPWVWGPLAAIFLLCLLDFRRLRKWVHLDLLVLLSFGVSQAFFNAAEIGVSVPLYYPPLVYLLLRLMWIGFRGPGRAGTAGEGLRPSAPRWLLIGLVIGLFAARIAANIADSGVIDVGYAGVIGADKITDAEPIYGDGSFPENNPTGDTYGPSNYFAYVPFEEVFPWSGAWDDLPAAHAAAITFDLATILGLYALGAAVTRRRRGEGLVGIDSAIGTQEYRYEEGSPTTPSPGLKAALLARARALSPTRRDNTLGLILVFAWVAYPYSAFALQSNSNDALLSALLVWSLVLFAAPLARGALLGAAALAKFAPLALVPLFAAGERGLSLRAEEGHRSQSRFASLRPVALFAAAFLAASVLFIAHPAVDPGLAAFYDRTVKSQVDRVSPFSIWGQADIEWIQTLAKLFAVGLGVLVAFVPRERSLTQVAALAGAVIIAIEITLEHWFYLYIPWFLPMLLLAMAVTSTSRRPPDSRSV